MRRDLLRVFERAAVLKVSGDPKSREKYVLADGRGWGRWRDKGTSSGAWSVPDLTIRFIKVRL
ncbi:MAG: hypothetical protein ACLQU2_28380 [Candidatus Binataceae bacterium]